MKNTQQSSNKIKFAKNESDFYKELKEDVKKIMTKHVISKATKLILYKLTIYSALYLSAYGLFFTELVASSYTYLIINYCLFGLLGILLTFNASHDAVHNTLFKSQRANSIVHYILFNLQGVNASLWKKRHLYSHHLFPNVDGCDADIDNNFLLRLSETHKHKKMHKYQYMYAPFAYALYTLHWILIKDFVYLKKERVANMVNLNYSKMFVLETISLKIIYFLITIILPTIFTDYTFMEILISFITMHFFISIFFVLTLIISHLTLETAFPMANDEGCLPYDYYTHQLAVSMDYHPTNKFANWIFGGFNSHAAHHLFPNIKHTLYTQITPSIQKFTNRYNLTYNELSIPNAIKSHFLFLKKLGIQK